MKISHSIFQRFGEDISLNGLAAKAFLSPVNRKRHDNIKMPTAVGVKNGAEYLLLCENELAPCGGDEVIHRGKHFVTLRAEPVFFSGEISHYEAVMRKKGGEAHV